MFFRGLINDSQSIKNFIFLCRQDRKAIIYFIIFITITAVLEAISIASLYPIVNILENPPLRVTYVQTINELFKLTLTPDLFITLLFIGLLIIFVIRGLFMIFSYYFQYRLSEKLKTNWQIDILKIYFKQNYNFFVENTTGDLIQKQMNHTEAAGNAVVYACQTIRNLFTAIFLFAALWLVSWKSAVFLIGLMIIMTIISLIFSKIKILAASEKHAELQKQAFSLVAEVISGIRQVKIFLAERFFIDVFSRTIKQKAEIYVKNATRGQAPGPIVQTIILVGLISALFYIFQYQTETDNLLPLVTVFAGTTYRIIGAISGINGELMQLTHLLPSIDIVTSLLQNTQATIQLEYQMPLFQQDIVFKNVTFSYPHKGILLQNFNWRIKKNGFYAIVGESGSGKSTLIDLLIKFYLPQDGQILIDGHDLKDIETASWLRQIGLISQETFIFNKTIGENIAFTADPDQVDQSRIVAAAQMAGLHEFINGLSLKYQTPTGERGLGLSGGQKQRLAIARTVYRDPAIYIFDEATSALDAHAEKHIRSVMENLHGKKTILTITHRLATIRQADEIIVLDKGRIAENGRHDALLKHNGLYAKLYRAQNI